MAGDIWVVRFWGSSFSSLYSSNTPVYTDEFWGGYHDPQFNGWHNPGDIQLAGDFMGIGNDQVFFINNSGSEGRVMIADKRTDGHTESIMYWESYGQSDLFNGWHNPGDIQLVGDFMGIGHAQVLFINNSGHDGRVLIADFSNGQPPAQVKYWESYGQSDLLNGWHNPGDFQLAGDFMGIGHAQVLFINNNSGAPGLILIADFSAGSSPATKRYLQKHLPDVTLEDRHTRDIHLVLHRKDGQKEYDNVFFFNVET